MNATRNKQVSVPRNDSRNKSTNAPTNEPMTKPRTKRRNNRRNYPRNVPPLNPAGTFRHLRVRLPKAYSGPALFYRTCQLCAYDFIGPKSQSRCAPCTTPKPERPRARS